MSKDKSEVPYGTLDLLILRTLETMGRMHGYALARRIEQVSGEALQLSQGSIYPALIRLQQEGWIDTTWGVSETNRKVKFYSLTESGRKQVAVEIAHLGEGDGAGCSIPGSRDVTIHGVFTRLAALIRKRQFEDELEGEIAAHLELAERDALASGMSPEQARIAARRQFGGIESMKEDTRLQEFPLAGECMAGRSLRLGEPGTRSRLHSCRGGRACAGHRRKRGHVRPPGCGDAEAASVRESRSDRAHLGSASSWRDECNQHTGLPRLAAHGDNVRGTGG